MERRDFLAAAGVAALASALPTRAAAVAPGKHGYGLIGRMDARPGQRDALAAILAEGTGAMPGCRLYFIAPDAAAPDRLWITESWDSRETHAASLKLPAVRDAISRARPLIADMEQVAELTPLNTIPE